MPTEENTDLEEELRPWRGCCRDTSSSLLLLHSTSDCCVRGVVQSVLRSSSCGDEVVMMSVADCARTALSLSFFLKVTEISRYLQLQRSRPSQNINYTQRRIVDTTAAAATTAAVDCNGMNESLPSVFCLVLLLLAAVLR